MDAGSTSRAAADHDEALASARIVLCAPEGPVRARIEATLELRGCELVGSCESAEALPPEVEHSEASLAVMAFGFEPFASSDELPAIRSALGDVPLVIVGSGFIGAACRRLVPRQIEGFVQEQQIEQALVPTIVAVLGEQLCFPASMRGTLAQPVFSHREKQVLELLLAGLTNNEIAVRLYLSESTVKSHLASSFRKLGVSSRAEAARCVLEPDSGLELRGLSTAQATSPSAG